MGVRFEKLVQFFKLKRDNRYPKGHLFAPLVADTALEDVCKSLGGHYITPDFCMSALCYDPSSPSRCRGARDAYVSKLY